MTDQPDNRRGQQPMTNEAGKQEVESEDNRTWGGISKRRFKTTDL